MSVPVVLDCDTGTDDAVACLVAAAVVEVRDGAPVRAASWADHDRFLDVVRGAWGPAPRLGEIRRRC